MDAMSSIVHGLSNMVNRDQDVFRNIFRRGHVYNNNTRGIACTNPPSYWLLGKDIMTSFKNVSIGT